MTVLQGQIRRLEYRKTSKARNTVTESERTSRHKLQESGKLLQKFLIKIHH